jgi:hypothetical protein
VEIQPVHVAPFSHVSRFTRHGLWLLAAFFSILLYDLTILHMHDPVGLGRQFVVVGDDHEGRPAGFIQFTHHGKERLACMGIQISGRFISQHEIRLLREGSCDCYALLFTAGQFTRLVM